MKTSLLVTALFAFVLTTYAEMTPDEIKAMAPSAIEKRLPGEHPSSYYQYSARLFGEGKRDDAVFWFYVGQLRYRVHLAANPKLDPSGDPALFASLNATIGAQINEYAGGDPKEWRSAIDRALQWDEKTKNGFTSKKEFKKKYEEVRSGLVKLGEWVTANEETIREQRKKNGQENRG